MSIQTETVEAKDVADTLREAGWSEFLIEEVEQRLQPTYVSPAFIEEIERECFRTQHDTGANANALAVWNRVRAAAGLNRLTMEDLVRRYVALSYADAQRAEDRGDYAEADRYRGIARKIKAENPKVYPPVQVAADATA